MASVNIVAIAISGTLFIIGLFIGRVSQLPKTAESKTEQKNPTPTATESATPTTTNAPTIAVTPSVSPPAPTNSQNNSSISLNEFIYPSATISNQSSTTLNLSSMDDPTKITNWYADRLKSQGFSSVSQAKTNSNGHILNKLAGSKNGTQISITIEKKTDSSSVSITVTLNNSSDNSVRVEIKNNSTTITN